MSAWVGVSPSSPGLFYMLRVRINDLQFADIPDKHSKRVLILLILEKEQRKEVRKRLTFSSLQG